MEEKENLYRSIKEGMDRLFDKYEESRQEMIDFIEFVKRDNNKRFKPGDIYLGLRYCSRKDCYFCPHSFVWCESYLIGNKLKSRIIGKTITKAFLRKRYKLEFYSYFKRLERQAKAIEKERNKYAGYIVSLRSELRRLARRNPRTT
jgi:hypothetical protein